MKTKVGCRSYLFFNIGVKIALMFLFLIVLFQHYFAIEVRQETGVLQDPSERQTDRKRTWRQFLCICLLIQVTQKVYDLKTGIHISNYCTYSKEKLPEMISLTYTVHGSVYMCFVHCWSIVEISFQWRFSVTRLHCKNEIGPGCLYERHTQ